MERLDEDCRNADRTSATFKSHSPDLSKWMAAKTADWKQRSDQLQADMISLDRDWQDHCEELEGLHMDLRVSEAMAHEAGVFPSEHHHQIRRFAITSPHANAGARWGVPMSRACWNFSGGSISTEQS